MNSCAWNRRGFAVTLFLSCLLLSSRCAWPQALQHGPTCGQVNSTLLQQHQLYLKYEQSREIRKGEVLKNFDWQHPPATYDERTFDPLMDKPIGSATAGPEQFVLEHSTLRGCAFAQKAQLDEAVFHGSDLTGSSFVDASLKNASFDRWDVKGTPTNLTGVNLSGADLTGATFAGAIMTGVNFEPDRLPSANGISEAQDLRHMTYDEDPSAMMSLRQLFRDAGFAEQDSEVNYAVHQRMLRSLHEQCAKGDDSACLSSLGWRWVDWTCEFGLNLWRPVEIGVAAWLVFALLFFVFMHHPGPSGLYLAVAERIVLDPEAVKNAPQVQAGSLREALRTQQLGAWLRDEVRLARIAAFFSLVNGFNLGFKDADIGRWIRLLPAREFEFRAVGWSRTFAGVQALLTLYLVAIWVLCLISHPFG